MNRNDLPNSNFPVPSTTGGLEALQVERTFLLRDIRPSNNLRDYMSIFFKHKIGIFFSFLAIVIIGSAGVVAYKTWIYKPIYMAKSSILIKFGWENYSPDLSLEKKQMPSVNQSEILSSEVRILESRELKDKVISLLKPETMLVDLSDINYVGLTKTEAALVLLDKHIVVNPMKNGGNVIDVTYEGHVPTVAAAVVNQLVNFYIEKRTEIYKDPKSVLFLEKKTEECRQKLAESEDRLKAFHNESKIISFEEQRSILLKQRADLIAAFNNASDQIKEVQERIAELEKQLDSLPKTTTSIGTYDSIRDTKTKLLNLQLQEKELVSKYKEDNPLVVNIRAQIAMVNEYLEKNASDGKKASFAPPDPVYQDVQKQLLFNRTEFSALKVRYADMEKQVAAINAEIQALEALENRNRELTREVTASEEKYRGFRQRLEEARVYDELDRQKMTSISVIEPAAVPVIPINPRPLPTLIAAVVGLGIVGSFGIAYLREMGKQVMSTPMEVERRLDLPVLITIPIKN